MAEVVAEPKRRWIRGGIFWLCIALSGLIAGSWVKSYWRGDIVRAKMGRVWMSIDDWRGEITITHEPWRLWFGEDIGWQIEHMPAYRFGRYGTVLLGFGCESSVFQGMQGIGQDTDVRIPHWFPLLLCLGGAWWTSRPWRKRKREYRRGFQVLPREPDHPSFDQNRP